MRARASAGITPALGIRGRARPGNRKEQTHAWAPGEGEAPQRERGQARVCTHSLTRNGWLTSFRTDFSLWTCCSCFSRMTSGMLMTFSAKKCFAVFSLTSCTRPKVPVPAGGQVTRPDWDVEGTASFAAGDWTRRQGTG